MKWPSLVLPTPETSLWGGWPGEEWERVGRVDEIEFSQDSISPGCTAFADDTRSKGTCADTLFESANSQPNDSPHLFAKKIGGARKSKSATGRLARTIAGGVVKVGALRVSMRAPKKIGGIGTQWSGELGGGSSAVTTSCSTP